MAESLKDMVYQSIITDIANGEYEQYEILNERTLVEKYKCSKSPVREALVSLCQNNILRNIPRCGYEVIPITQEDVEQMLQLRYLLEAGMIQCSIEHLNENDFLSLEEYNSHLTFGEDDIWEYWYWNVNFHLKLISLSGNSYAYHEVKRICEKLRLAYAQIGKTRWKSRSIPYQPEAHNEIICRLRERDVVGVRRALRNDLKLFSDTEHYIPNFFLDSELYIPQK